MNFSTIISAPKPTSSSTLLSLSQSKLHTDHPQVAGDVETRLVEARRLGASEGVQRVAFVCNQYDRLTPDDAYHWINPLAFQHEVEDIQSNKAEAWHIIRNCISLLPLVFTWFALFMAASSYHDCLNANQCEITTPFLELWQKDGFAGRTFTFASAALLDVLLLLSYLLL